MSKTLSKHFEKNQCFKNYYKMFCWKCFSKISINSKQNISKKGSCYLGYQWYPHLLQLTRVKISIFRETIKSIARLPPFVFVVKVYWKEILSLAIGDDRRGSPELFDYKLFNKNNWLFNIHDLKKSNQISSIYLTILDQLTAGKFFMTQCKESRR